MVERAFDDYGFGHWKRVSGEMKIQHPFSMFSDFPFVLVCTNTGGVCARGCRSELATNLLILRLTGEHEIPEKRELVDDPDCHLQA